jgi:hypothetical protein
MLRSILGFVCYLRTAHQKSCRHRTLLGILTRLNLLALVVSGNYLLLYLLKICGVVHFMWYGLMERSVACL